MMTYGKGKINLRRGIRNWIHDNFNRVIGNPFIGKYFSKTLKEAKEVGMWLPGEECSRQRKPQTERP